MNRVFTLSFDFQEKARTALIFLKACGTSPYLQVRFLDEDLEKVLPGRQLELRQAGERVVPVSSAGNGAEELIFCASAAISGYLKEHQIA